MSDIEKVGVVVLHYSGLNNTLACLSSLAKVQSKRSLSFYVVVMTNKDGDTLHSANKDMEVIEIADNIGFAGGSNLGMERAFSDGCDDVVILNNDTVVDAHFLDPLIDVVHQQNVGLVSPLIYFYPGKEFHRDSYHESEQGKVVWYAGGLIDWANVDAYHWGVNEVDHGQFDNPVEVDFATGCCTAISKENFQQIGKLKEDYFLYFEDTDWSMQAKKHNLKIMLEPKATIWHKNAGSTEGPGSPTHVYYQTRNRLVFGWRHAPLKTKLHLFKQALHWWKHGTADQKQAARDALLGRMGKRG